MVAQPLPDAAEEAAVRETTRLALVYSASGEAAAAATEAAPVAVVAGEATTAAATGGGAAAGGGTILGLSAATLWTAGIALVVAALGGIAYLIYKHKSSVPPGPKALQQCGSASEEVPCFKVPAGADREEFARQLKEQQDALNEMKPEDYLKRRANYNKSNRDVQAQREARDNYEKTHVDQYTKENIANGMDPTEAEDAAEERIANEMKTLDATHRLDMIAGGDPSDISGLGDSSINRSIGSQWTKDDRLKKLDDRAEKAGKEGKNSMDVKLTICD